MSNPSAKRAAVLRARARARGYIEEIRARTPCAHCGAPMADWHNPEHVSRPTRRVALLVSAGRSLATIAAEIAVCTPLCRRCHMAEDGRLTGFIPAPTPGERNASAKLSRDQVLAIRQRVAALRAQAAERGAKHVARGALSALATEFGVSPNAIGAIARGDRWAHLEEDAA